MGRGALVVTTGLISTYPSLSLCPKSRLRRQTLYPLLLHCQILQPSRCLPYLLLSIMLVRTSHPARRMMRKKGNIGIRKMTNIRKRRKRKRKRKRKKEKKVMRKRKISFRNENKSKKKSKDRDKEKEREKDRSKAPSGTPSTPSLGKLTIKMGTPTVSPGRSTSEQEQGSSQATTPGSQPAIPKIKLKLGGNITQIITPESSSKKDRDKDSSRKRSSSAVKLDKLEGPAAKMARAIGTDPSKEARFLEENMKKSSDRKVVKPRLLPN